MSKLAIVTVSTRPGRKGAAIAQWFYEQAQNQGQFDVEIIDLAAVNLPLFNENGHPRLKQYEYEHTKAWSAQIEAIDSFVFVTPEYNYSCPPSLVNALDYLYSEWNYKAAGFVSYGGLSGGTRAVESTKQLLTTLKMVPIVEAVNIPFFPQHVSEDGQFQATETHNKSAQVLLDELFKWEQALKTLRA